MVDYNFDRPIDRRHSSGLKWDKYKGKDILPLWVADMDFRVADPIMEVLQKRLDHGVFGYALPPSELTTVVIQMLANEYNWHIDEQWLVWLPGVVPGLSTACRAVGDSGDDVLCAIPIYHHFLHVAQRSNKNLNTVPLRLIDERWTFDFDELEAAFTPSTSLFLLCNPHNPTGTVFTPQELQQITSICQRHGTILCTDDIHCGLILDEDKCHTVVAVADPDFAAQTITLMAPSKTFNLAGENCSFAVIPDPAIRAKFIGATKSILPGISPFAYDAALAAFRDGGEWRQQLLTYLRHNRDVLQAAIDEMDLLAMTHVEATYLAWIDVSKLQLDRPVQFFEDAGVGLSPGREFGDSNFVRLNFACTTATLLEAIGRIRTAIGGLSQG